MNFARYQRGPETLRIAIGDNLLSKEFASHLMRLNKSFIVKRSEKGRAMLAAYKHLSRYIRHSIELDNNSVWIAQREGRAKECVESAEELALWLDRQIVGQYVLHPSNVLLIRPLQ